MIANQYIEVRKNYLQELDRIALDEHKLKVKLKMLTKERNALKKVMTEWDGKLIEI